MVKGGVLAGVRIIELAGVGPAPFCGMMLADHGAEVIRIGRIHATEDILGAAERDVLNRSRIPLAVNLKNPGGAALVRRLAQSSDGLIEGFRPGTMERLGLGPNVLMSDNPKLVYGRMTGWGQYGPLADAAGHDINYISLSGALDACGRANQQPTPPLNMVGDFGGGGMMLAFGVVSAILHARLHGKGQVIDCAMTEGSALLMAMTYSARANGRWSGERGKNLLDSGAHFYETYETADGKYLAVGSIEPQFYDLLVKLLDLKQEELLKNQMSREIWPVQKDILAERFRSKTLEEWCKIMEGTDVCFAPVLSMDDAPYHPHNRERKSFIEIDGIVQPAPAPRFSASPAETPTMMKLDNGESVLHILGEAGYTEEDLARMRRQGIIG